MTARFQKLLEENDLILMEGAVIEILRRTCNLSLHPTLLNTPFIYSEFDALEMKKIYKSYIQIAVEADVPFIMCSPTWRANHQNITSSGVKNTLNYDAVSFMKSIRTEYKNFQNNIFIGGLIGPKHDCYKPEEGLPSKVATQFHAWQIQELVKAGTDFIIAQTLPNVQEALGIAEACSMFECPYIISFVISREGKILDGTSLMDAINMIDDNVKIPPVGYFVNCAHPTFLCASQQPKALFQRLIGYLGNASALDHCDLECAGDLHVDNISEWGEAMLRLNQKFGVKILGGCCGTDARHISYLCHS